MTVVIVYTDYEMEMKKEMHRAFTGSKSMKKKTHSLMDELEKALQSLF